MHRLLSVSLLFLLMVLLVLPAALGRLLVGTTAGAVQAPDGPDALPIRVYFPADQTVRALPLGEYLVGVAAAEMPPEFATEALKAQMVVARTYAVRRMQLFAGPGKGGCPQHPEADVCADHTASQAYMTREEAMRQYGTFTGMQYWRKLEEVQRETEGLVLRYRGELIDPLYHSVSGRMTEDAGAYFRQSLPYLQPVDDQWGAGAPRLVENREFTLSELARLLSVDGDAVPVAAMGGQPVEILARTATGRVATVRVAGVTISGRQFRERLGLRSADFRVTVGEGSIRVETHGYGHGVGMSQYGADGMARAGHTFEQILLHYYTGVTLGPLFAE